MGLVWGAKYWLWVKVAGTKFKYHSGTIDSQRWNMPTAPEELSPTVVCPRKDCKADIPVIDCYYIAQAHIPQIGVTCPECGKPTMLSKAKTIAYAKEYSQIQLDIDNAAGYKAAESEDDADFGDLIIRGLDSFGYGGPKNTQRKKIIRSMVDTVPTYQTPQGLQQLLLAQKIKPTDAMMISQFVFASGDESAMALPGMGLPQQFGQPQMPMPQSPYQQPQQFGQPQIMYQQPNAPQYPYQQPVQPPYQQPAPPPQPQQTADEGITIVEKLDEDGNVVERTIRQPKTEQPVGPAPAEQSTIDQFKELIGMMTEAGMINTSVEPELSQPLTADAIGEVLATYLGNDKPEHDDGKYDTMLSEVKTLRADLANREKAEMQAQIDQLKGEVSKPRHDLSDSQFAETTKKDIESLRIDAGREVLGDLAKPLLEMQANQAKLQAVLVIRQLEQQDNTAPGTYMQVIGNSSVPDEAVKSDIDKWRARAEKAGA
jgi:hypothetical protein